MNGLIKKLNSVLNRSDSRPQLRMVFPELLRTPDDSILPKGFRSRCYREEDRNRWLNLLIENGELGSWNQERFQQILSGQPVYSGQQFVFNGEDIVACAGAYMRPHNGSQSWEIGWIATDPNYFGMGLGYHVIIRAIRFARFHRPHPIFLLTDDFRIPAISLYLKIGYYPSALNEKKIISRWMKIVNELNDPEAEKLTKYIKNRHN